MSVSVLGAGAFGTALAGSLASGGRPIHLWGRNQRVLDQINASHENMAYLPEIKLPESLVGTLNLKQACRAQTILLALPAQQLRDFAARHASLLDHKTLIICAKGIDLKTGESPSALIEQSCPNADVAVLTGPSFAVDIARGLPTALTLAAPKQDRSIQEELSTANIRLYSTSDRLGAELGGALKNVIAIACGAAIGGGLGESARAALMTRGFAEMRRFAESRGARPDTLSGLSGLGDLVLTCTSDKSRNYAAGLRIGAGEPIATGRTVEGIPTSQALVAIAEREKLEMPIAVAVSHLVAGRYSVSDALQDLLNRPLKEE